MDCLFEPDPRGWRCRVCGSVVSDDKPPRQNCRADRPAPQPGPPPATTASDAPPGPGDTLHALLRLAFGYDVVADCPCARRIRQMNAWGPAECRRRVDEIALWLIEEAQRRRWDDKRSAISGQWSADGSEPVWWQRLARRAAQRFESPEVVARFVRLALWLNRRGWPKTALTSPADGG